MTNNLDNVFSQKLKVTQQQREAANKQKSFTVWLTGLSASGKSTLATEIDLWLYNNGYSSYVLDGDNTRLGINKDLGFSDDDRQENIRRVAEICRLFNDAGIIAIAAYISPFEKDRLNAQRIIGQDVFVEVHIDATVETCMSRDRKGLYAKALNGEIDNFTGITGNFEAPTSPQIHIDTNKLTVKESLDILISQLKMLGKIA